MIAASNAVEARAGRDSGHRGPASAVELRSKREKVDPFKGRPAGGHHAAPVLDMPRPASSAQTASGPSITEDTLKFIRSTVRFACIGSRLRPEERFDVGQQVAMQLVSGEQGSAEGLIVAKAKGLVRDALDRSRTERAALEHMYTIGAAPGYNAGSLKRDPLTNYMAVKALRRDSGGNDTEDAMILAIDARSRNKLGPKSAPTCPQDLFARRCKLANLRRVTSHEAGKNRKRVVGSTDIHKRART